jgi:hypothetical protein
VPNIYGVRSFRSGAGFAALLGALLLGLPAAGAATVPGHAAHRSMPPVKSAFHPILPPRQPLASIKPEPYFYFVCSHETASAPLAPACIARAQQAYANARAAEGLGPLQLPSDFASLTQAEQLFVLIDVERVERGLAPVIGMSAALDTVALAGARANTDPTGVPSQFDGVRLTWDRVNWADDADVLGANYEFMYDDGPGAGNLDCTATVHTGCWDHRANILYPVRPGDLKKGQVLLAGTAAAPAPGAQSAYWNSYTELVVMGTGTPSDLVYTWAQAVANGAG